MRFPALFQAAGQWQGQNKTMCGKESARCILQAKEVPELGMVARPDPTECETPLEGAQQDQDSDVS